MSISPEQARAARGLLDWTQGELAEAAGLGRSTIIDFERDRREVSPEAVRAIRETFERAGVRFGPRHRVELADPR